MYVPHVPLEKNGNVKKQIIKLNYPGDFIASIRYKGGPLALTNDINL